MKRAIILIAVAALVAACCFVGCSSSSELISTATKKLSPAIEKVEKLLSEAEGAGDQAASEDAESTEADSETAEGQANAREGASGWSLPFLENLSLGSGKLSSVDDIVLVPTDDYAQGYVFTYDGEEFIAYFDTYSWKVYDSYKITNHDDIVIICQALINEHPVYGSDWESLRTAEDMAYEWDQHNIAYKMLPEDSHWRDDAKDVDLDPYDQGKSFEEMYESRTGREFDIRNYLPGE